MNSTTPVTALHTADEILKAYLELDAKFYPAGNNRNIAILQALQECAAQF